MNYIETMEELLKQIQDHKNEIEAFTADDKRIWTNTK